LKEDRAMDLYSSKGGPRKNRLSPEKKEEGLELKLNCEKWIKNKSKKTLCERGGTKKKGWGNLRSRAVSEGSGLLRKRERCHCETGTMQVSRRGDELPDAGQASREDFGGKEGGGKTMKRERGARLNAAR